MDARANGCLARVVTEWADAGEEQGFPAVITVVSFYFDFGFGNADILIRHLIEGIEYVVEYMSF